MTEKWKKIGAGILAPNHSDLNSDTGLLKLIAMLTMLCDHMGAQLFPQYRIMRIIGRIAFPIYAYCIASGCAYTKNIRKYLTRVTFLGLLSQPIYAYAMNHTTGAMYTIKFTERPVAAVFNYYVNSWHHSGILFTLALGICVIWTIRERQFILTAALALLIWKIKGNVDYGWFGVALIVLFYLTLSKRWIAAPVMLAFMVYWGTRSSGYSFLGVKFGIQMFTVLSLPIILIRAKTGLKLPKWLGYGFYPGHLILIMILKWLFK